MAGERAIRIEAGGVRLYAILDATPTAGAVWEALPIEGRARLRGQEVAIDVGLRCAPEPQTGRAVRSGDLGYRPEGPAIVLYFGPAPEGAGPETAAAAPVNVFGRVTGDATRLGRVGEGDRVRLSALGD